jgi:sigma-E factor negative regulatory protein RseB
MAGVDVNRHEPDELPGNVRLHWILGDDHSVLEDSAFNRSFFPELPADQQEQISRSYSLKFGRTERIAGQSARNLKILPRDTYRYGYSLWLEKHSGLLLKWELIDSNRNSLAKLMFTDIRLGSEVDTRELKPSNQFKKFKTVESKLPAGRGISHGNPRWKPDRLPPGFELTTHRIFGKAGEDMYEHLVYSDGLAAVSIYIEGNLTNEEKQSELRSVETTHAFTRTAENVIITVMGDVPAATVQFIANAVGPVYP